MANRYLVAYDLHLKNYENYRRVADAIESCGDSLEFQESVWIVYSSMDRDDIGENIWSVMESDDKLFVTPIKGAFHRGHASGLKTFLSEHKNPE